MGIFDVELWMLKTATAATTTLRVQLRTTRESYFVEATVREADVRSLCHRYSQRTEALDERFCNEIADFLFPGAITGKLAQIIEDNDRTRITMCLDRDLHWIFDFPWEAAFKPGTSRQGMLKDGKISFFRRPVNAPIYSSVNFGPGPLSVTYAGGPNSLGDRSYDTLGDHAKVVGRIRTSLGIKGCENRLKFHYLAEPTWPTFVESARDSHIAQFSGHGDDAYGELGLVFWLFAMTCGEASVR